MNNQDLRTASRAMNLNRRQLLGFGALGLSAAALAACSGPSVAGPGAASASPAETLDFAGVKPAKTIEFWSNHPGSSQKTEQEMIDAFHASQSDVKVTLVTAGANYDDVATKYQTALAGGGLPGLVIFSDVWWFRYYLNKSIIPLDSLLTHLEVDTADYQDTLFNDYKYDDQHWAVPFARSTPIFYYNKTAFSKAGLPDRAPTTWSEFEEWAPKLMSSSGMPTAFEYGAAADSPSWLLENLFWGYGAAYSDKFDVTINSPKAIEATEWMKKSIYESKWAKAAPTSSADDFAAGVTAAMVNSTGGLVGIQKSAGNKFEMGVGPLPGGPATSSPVCPTGGAGIGIPKDITPEEQLAAGMFLKFVTSPENAVKFSAATGYMPTRKSADTSGLIAKNPLIATAIKQLPNTRSQDYARAFLPGGDRILIDTFAAITTQNQDVKTVLDATKPKLESIYTGQVKPNLPSA